MSVGAGLGDGVGSVVVGDGVGDGVGLSVALFVLAALRTENRAAAANIMAKRRSVTCGSRSLCRAGRVVGSRRLASSHAWRVLTKIQGN